MAGQAPEQEPSIEEILASIRQIISDDDAGTPAASADPEPVSEPVAPPPPPKPAPAAPKEDVLELKNPLPGQQPAARPVIAMEDADDEPLPPVRFEPPAQDDEPVSGADDFASSILTDTARSAALSGFARLASNLPLERTASPQRSSGDGTTLEDIVRDMLNPLLREWLDENLPAIIEKLVQKELAKLSRRALDD